MPCTGYTLRQAGLLTHCLAPGPGKQWGCHGNRRQRALRGAPTPVTMETWNTSASWSAAPPEASRCSTAPRASSSSQARYSLPECVPELASATLNRLLLWPFDLSEVKTQEKSINPIERGKGAPGSTTLPVERCETSAHAGGSPCAPTRTLQLAGDSRFPDPRRSCAGGA